MKDQWIRDMRRLLDDYEKDLGFVPFFVSAEEACRINISILGSGNEPAWTKREVLVLEKLLEANPQMTQIAWIGETTGA